MIFKPGDRVRCIDAKRTSLAVGEVFDISSVDGSLVVLRGRESWGQYNATRFELVENANKYARRIRSIPLIVTDVYEILDAYDVRCPAVQHAVKKLLCAGQRGVKSRLQDLKESKAAIERAIEMEERR